MEAFVSGIGLALPDNPVSQEAAASIAGEISPKQMDALALLYKRTGVQRRHTVLLQESRDRNSILSFFRPKRNEEDRGPSTAERMELYERYGLALALEAGKKALDEASISASQVTHLITVSCTGFSAPGFDIGLIGGLGLSNSTQRVQVGFMGCHAAVNALRVADAIASGNSAACVLLCAVELCSLHYSYKSEKDAAVSNALFSDGAAAVVVRSAGPNEAWRIGEGASYLIPGSLDYMSWKIRDHGFEMTLSADLPHLIENHLRGWLCTWLKQQGLTVDTIGGWAIHPGGPLILDKVEKSLELNKNALRCSRQILAQCGNMSSATVLFVIGLLRKEQNPLPCLSMAFGPGVFCEALLFY